MAKDEQVTLPLAQLILDYEVYPRNSIDTLNVRALVDALESGHVLPPIVADKKTKRLSDGFHRYKAYERHGGPSTEVPVILRDYQSDADLFADAVRLNAAHGKRLTPYDIAVVSTRAQQFGLTRESVAAALGITRDRFEELTQDRVAHEGTTPVLLKRSVRHLAGTTLTHEQVDVNRHLSGWSPRFHARQLLMLIDFGLDDLDDETVADLKRLQEALSRLV